MVLFQVFEDGYPVQERIKDQHLDCCSFFYIFIRKKKSNKSRNPSNLIFLVYKIVIIILLQRAGEKEEVEVKKRKRKIRKRSRESGTTYWTLGTSTSPSDNCVSTSQWGHTLFCHILQRHPDLPKVTLLLILKYDDLFISFLYLMLFVPQIIIYYINIIIFQLKQWTTLNVIYIQEFSAIFLPLFGCTLACQCLPGNESLRQSITVY